MSRNSEILDENITIHAGSDHAIGHFFDITDKRFAQSGRDEQGEGYVCEFSTMFGISNNKIEITYEGLQVEEVINQKCNEFIEKLNKGLLDDKYPIL